MTDNEGVGLGGSTPLMLAAREARAQALQTRLDGAALRARLALAATLRSDLSPREVHTLTLVSQGLTTKQIAVSLEVSANTAKYHLKNAYRKLGVHSRVQASLAFRAMSLRDRNREGSMGPPSSQSIRPTTAPR